MIARDDVVLQLSEYVATRHGYAVEIGRYREIRMSAVVGGERQWFGLHRFQQVSVGDAESECMRMARKRDPYGPELRQDIAGGLSALHAALRGRAEPRDDREAVVLVTFVAIPKRVNNILAASDDALQLIVAGSEGRGFFAHGFNMNDEGHLVHGVFERQELLERSYFLFGRSARASTTIER